LLLDGRLLRRLLRLLLLAITASPGLVIEAKFVTKVSLQGSHACSAGRSSPEDQGSLAAGARTSKVIGQGKLGRSLEYPP